MLSQLGISAERGVFASRPGERVVSTVSLPKNRGGRGEFGKETGTLVSGYIWGLDKIVLVVKLAVILIDSVPQLSQNNAIA